MEFPTTRVRKKDITFIKSSVNFPILKMQFNSPEPKVREEKEMRMKNLYHDRICNLSEFNCAISSTIFLYAFFYRSDTERKIEQVDQVQFFQSFFFVFIWAIHRNDSL